MNGIRKKIAYAGMIVLSAALLFSGMKVYAESRASVYGELSLGEVDIRLDTDSDVSEVLPGQTVPFRPVIRIQGYSCYVRVSYEFSDYAEYISVSDIPGRWIFKKEDGKWYCPEPLKNGDEICLFEKIRFDRSLPAEAAGKKIRLNIRAEAVQIRNFEPNLESASPWQDILTEKYSGSFDLNVTEGAFSPGVLGVTYKGGADQIVTDHESFFSTIPVLMPGDEFTQSAVLSNTGAKPVRLYFFSESDQEDLLLRSSTLSISTDDQGLIYTGPLSAPSLNGEGRAVLISELKASGSGRMTFSISIPNELRNEYALKKSTVKWTFTALADAEVPNTSGSAYSAGPVRTGDGNSPGFYLILGGSALFILSTGLYLTGKKGKVKQ